MSKDKRNKIYKCIIIGAGASGLMCAANIPSGGLILEATSRIGTKLLVSGHGHCNITHSGNIKDFPQCYGNAGRSIRKILYKYNNDDLIDFLESHGVRTIENEEGRVFPASMRAEEIKNVFTQIAEDNGFSIVTNRKVISISNLANSDTIEIVAASPDGHEFVYHTQNLVVATGGKSYPLSGSDGSMYRVMEDYLGVKHSELTPSLVPINVKAYPYSELSGISFQSAEISIFPKSGKRIAQISGSLLFTHNNFSGPAILNISKYADIGCSLVINYIGISREEALQRICNSGSVVSNSKSAQDLSNYTVNHHKSYSQISKNQNIRSQNNRGQDVRNQLSHNQINENQNNRAQKFRSQGGAELAAILIREFALPRRFAKLMAKRAAGSQKKAAVLLTEDRFEVESRGDFDRAMVTAGGLLLGQFDCKTLQLKSRPGIYCIGEILDVDGITGGYNLQFAWSSAQAAAASITDSD